MILNFLTSFFVFIFGLCIGSFLNCLIYRLYLETNDRSFRGKVRSYCPKCKKQLKWQDLIPVFSFLFLRGKCRYCKKSISVQYPLVELITGLLFLLIFNFIIFNFINNSLIFKFLNAGFLFYIASSLIVIFVYDLKHYIIPDKILFSAIIITFLYRLFENLIIKNWNLIENWKLKIENFATISNFLLAALISSGFFLTIFLISKGRWMGFGDVKLAILMGLLLGLPDIFVALFLAFFFGAIIGLMLMALGKKGLKSEIPFGPFLIAGTFMAFFWGQEIIEWYMIFLI